ncbi:MAG: penicillin-binding transpeptidase domain-containing protein, partial [Terracidiphilus sp.]
YSAALDQRVAKPDDMIDCQGGQITLAGRVIHDDKSDRGLGVVSVATALARSSDVAAVKLALKVGPDRFYQYIRDFGFGSRTGMELPGETRGLLRAPAKWSGSSIGSIAIGQEVGVTPLQLVSMVSTIANGGVYLPPRILMPGQIDHLANGQPAPALQASPFKPGEDLPEPLPPGAHRVISTLSAAQMRQMMEGVVLYGTGKPAQLNGYSSGGKTGTAQKVDPVTHLYSKTMHIASFAGIAPVNNPVIAVAIVMDSPKGDYYGTAVSAPVFAEVAQQVLEYLGVPHDIEVRAQPEQAKATEVTSEDDTGADQGTVDALYAAANDLPADDPLRDPQTSAVTSGGATAAPTAAASASGPLPARTAPPPAKLSVSAEQAQQTPATPQQSIARLQMLDAKKLTVPSLVGLPIRKVIEIAAGAGLDVQILGTGTAHEQAPAPGTQVPAGTRIVVHFRR